MASYRSYSYAVEGYKKWSKYRIMKGYEKEDNTNTIR